MAQLQNYIAYVQIGGRKVAVYVSAGSPEDVVGIVQELFKEIEPKMEGSIKVADEASGYLLRGFS